jgi:hypothetical protein
MGITWNHVAVSPNLAGEFPARRADNLATTPLTRDCFLAARVQTSAGEQREKFLFYRGVSASPLPLSARSTSDGRLLVKVLTETIPNAIL